MATQFMNLPTGSTPTRYHERHRNFSSFAENVNEFLDSLNFHGEFELERNLFALLSDVYNYPVYSPLDIKKLYIGDKFRRGLFDFCGRFQSDSIVNLIVPRRFGGSYQASPAALRDRAAGSFQPTEQRT